MAHTPSDTPDFTSLEARYVFVNQRPEDHRQQHAPYFDPNDQTDPRGSHSIPSSRHPRHDVDPKSRDGIAVSRFSAKDDNSTVEPKYPTLINKPKLDVETIAADLASIGIPLGFLIFAVVAWFKHENDGKTEDIERWVNIAAIVSHFFTRACEVAHSPSSSQHYFPSSLQPLLDDSWLKPHAGSSNQAARCKV